MLLEGVQAWMWVPLAVKGRVIGGIGVAHAKRDYFSKHHADLALTVANQAAVTLINAELHKNAQSLAVLQERQRLAQNLHDAINQSLFSAGLIAEVLPDIWDMDPEEARSILRAQKDERYGFGFALSPYRGCGHGCAYCYVREYPNELHGAQNPVGPGADGSSRVLDSGLYSHAGRASSTV